MTLLFSLHILAQNTFGLDGLVRFNCLNILTVNTQTAQSFAMFLVTFLVGIFVLWIPFVNHLIIIFRLYVLYYFILSSTLSLLPYRRNCFSTSLGLEPLNPSLDCWAAPNRCDFTPNVFAQFGHGLDTRLNHSMSKGHHSDVNYG